MLNKAQVIGRVGGDPEIKYLPSGDAVANFSVATTEKWKDKNSGEQQERTEWHRVNAFGKLAEIIGEYVTKGMLIYVEGRLTTREWEKDGQKHYSTEIKCDNMKMLSRPDGDENATRQQQRPAQRPAQQQRPAAGNQQRPAQQRSASGFEDMDDDIPF